MPLSKKKDKERKWLSRHNVQPNSNLNSSNLTTRPKIPGLIMKGNKILGIERRTTINTQPLKYPDLYNTPEIDADGHQIPDY